MESSPHRNSYIGGSSLWCSMSALSFPQKQEQPAGRENTSPSLSASLLSSYRYRPNLATLVYTFRYSTTSRIPWASFSQMHLVKSSWMTSWKLSKRDAFQQCLHALIRLATITPLYDFFCLIVLDDSKYLWEEKFYALILMLLHISDEKEEAIQFAHFVERWQPSKTSKNF